MSDEEDVARRLLKAAEMDRTQAGVAELGALAGVLFQSLSERMPPALASTLTRDWFFTHLSRSLWPDYGPPNLFWDTGGDQ